MISYDMITYDVILNNDNYYFIQFLVIIVIIVVIFIKIDRYQNNLIVIITCLPNDFNRL